MELLCLSACLSICLWCLKTPPFGVFGDFWSKFVSQILGCDDTIYVLAMAQNYRIGHDHWAPFWHLVLVVLGTSSSDTRKKQSTTWVIYLGPQIFLQFLNPGLNPWFLFLFLFSKKIPFFNFIWVLGASLLWIMGELAGGGSTLLPPSLPPPPLPPSQIVQ